MKTFTDVSQASDNLFGNLLIQKQRLKEHIYKKVKDAVVNGHNGEYDVTFDGITIEPSDNQRAKEMEYGSVTNNKSAVPVWRPIIKQLKNN